MHVMHVEVMLNQISVIGYGNNTYCKAYTSFDKRIDKNS